LVEYSKLSCQEKLEQNLTDCVDGDDYGFRVKSGPRDVNVQLVNVAGHEGEGQTFKINQILNYTSHKIKGITECFISPSIVV
jgi:hypothetical protein